MTHRVLDVSLVQLTHLAIRPDDFGLALVQERDRIGRLTPASRWVWKRELREPIEELAIGPYGFVAVSSHAGRLLVFDPAGELTSSFTFEPSDSPLLIEAPEDSPPQVAWVTLARRSQFLRGHDVRGKVLWEHRFPGKVGHYTVWDDSCWPPPPTAGPWHASDRANSIRLPGTPAIPTTRSLSIRPVSRYGFLGEAPI